MSERCTFRQTLSDNVTFAHRPAWDEKNPNSPEVHKEHGVANKKFEAALRSWVPLPNRPASARGKQKKPLSAAHTEALRGGATRLFTDTVNVPSWKSSNKAKPSLLYQPKFGRKGIEAHL